MPQTRLRFQREMVGLEADGSGEEWEDEGEGGVKEERGGKGVGVIGSGKRGEKRKESGAGVGKG